MRAAGPHTPGPVSFMCYKPVEFEQLQKRRVVVRMWGCAAFSNSGTQKR